MKKWLKEFTCFNYFVFFILLKNCSSKYKFQVPNRLIQSNQNPCNQLVYIDFRLAIESDEIDGYKNLFLIGSFVILLKYKLAFNR